MQLILPLVLILLLIFGPQWWVRSVLNRYNRREEAFPGTGGELARHLLDRYQLERVRVEVAEGVGDHYDPEALAVRLTRDKLEGKTLTSIVAAAHEVGHAIQHAAGYGPFLWRMRLVRFALVADRIGSFLLFSVPIIALVTRAPGSGVLMFAAAAMTLGMGLLVQLVTLPVEWDASFGRAMPLLQGGYLEPEQQRPAKRILRACALTYVAASLAGLVNFWRWFRLLRP
jgi:Zn-dependent membrane protease YugP